MNRPTLTENQLRVLSLFAGIGGFDLGLERTGGFKTAAFCEIDKKAQGVLRKHWPGVPIYDDVSTLTAERLAADGVAVDVIVGGFPCQDISTAGLGAGIDGERSGLWAEFARLIGELRPGYIIVENVSALLNRGLDRVLGDLAALGYNAWWDCIPAYAVGAPHRRDRIWIVAHCTGNRWQQGQQNCGGGASRASPGKERRSGNCREALADAAITGRPTRGLRGRPEACGEIFNNELAHCGSTMADAYSERGRCGPAWVKDAENARQSPGHPQFGGWDFEPPVGRVANGVPGRVDRLKQLGNAVVPQIPELIGRAILASMEAERLAA